MLYPNSITIASFADEPLLERMRILATDNFTDVRVKKKMSQLFLKWASKYKDVQGMQQVCLLYKQLPQRKRAPPKRQRFVDMDDDMEDEDEDEEDDGDDDSSSLPPRKPNRPRASSEAGPSHGRERERANRSEHSSRHGSPAPGGGYGRSTPKFKNAPTSSARSSSTTPTITKSKSKKRQPVPFDMQKEKPLLIRTLSEAGTAATNLQNALKLVNREKELACDNMRATECFNTCRKLRRLVLRYIQHIESEDYIGSLIHANDELVTALQLYDKMSQPIDEDSDSEDYSDSEEDELDEELDRHQSSRLSDKRSGSEARKTSNSHNRAASSEHVPTAEQLAHKRRPPPIPVKSQVLSEFKAKMVINDVDEVEDDPFGDAAKIETPSVEKSQMTWREV